MAIKEEKGNKLYMIGVIIIGGGGLLILFTVLYAAPTFVAGKIAAALEKFLR